MAHDKLTAAVARYQAMAGHIKDVPVGAARRAKADQRRYAEAHLPKRGKRQAEPLFMIRFLVSVCGLSLREASQAVRAEMLKDQKQSWEPQGETVLEIAEKLLKATGDILDAVVLARFYGWIAFHPDDWNEVRRELAALAMTEEATGIENWQEPAPEGWVDSLPSPEACERRGRPINAETITRRYANPDLA
jgi:hypothetical protein